MCVAHLPLLNMTLEDYLFTKKTRYVIWGAAGFVVVLLAVHASMVVNSHRAEYGSDHKSGKMFFAFVPSPGEAYIEGGHGAVGTVSNLTLPHFTLVTRGGMSQAVYAATGTVVTLGPGLATTTYALQNGLVVMIIGDPHDEDNRYIEARIIRVLPPPPQR